MMPLAIPLIMLHTVLQQFLFLFLFLFFFFQIPFLFCHFSVKFFYLKLTFSFVSLSLGQEGQLVTGSLWLLEIAHPALLILEVNLLLRKLVFPSLSALYFFLFFLFFLFFSKMFKSSWSCGVNV